jgi:nucleotide-binding universal stress UspA family protein
MVPKEVEARGVDMIALGGFHSSRVTRDLLARQRQQIVDHAACPVLVVK